MKRVLQSTVGLIGLMLVVLVTPLSAMRAHSPTLPLIIASGVDPNTGQLRLYQTVLGSTVQHPLTTAFDELYFVAGPSPDQWVYFEGVDHVFNPQTAAFDSLVAVYRVQLNGTHQQQLIFPMDANQWGYTTALTPDFQTIIYSMFSPGSGYSQVYRANADGTGATAITPTDWHIVPQNIVEDGSATWLIAHAYFGVDGPYLVRLALDGSDVQRLTQDFSSPRFEGWLPEVGWLLVSARTRLWKMRLDGTERSAIGPVNLDSLVGWLPDEQIIVVMGRRDDATSRGFMHMTLWGLRLGDGAVLWELPTALWRGVSPDGQWVATLTYHYDLNQSHVTGSVIERMHPDGSGREAVVETDGFIADVVWSADNQMLYYTSTSPTGEESLWRFNLRDKTQVERRITTGIGPPLYIWSPDQQYVLGGSRWVAVNSGKQGVILPHLKSGGFVTWVKADQRDWSPVGLLSWGGVLLVGGLVRRRGKRKS